MSLKAVALGIPQQTVKQGLAMLKEGNIQDATVAINQISEAQEKYVTAKEYSRSQQFKLCPIKFQLFILEIIQEWELSQLKEKHIDTFINTIQSHSNSPKDKYNIALEYYNSLTFYSLPIRVKIFLLESIFHWENKPQILVAEWVKANDEAYLSALLRLMESKGINPLQY